MITWGRKVAVVSMIAAHGACGHVDPLYALSARELKQQHEENLKQYHFWQERLKDALPKELMKQQRAEAERLVTGQIATIDNLRRQIAIKETELIELQHRLRHEEARKESLIKNSNDWKQRSTAEKANRKLGELRAKLRLLQEAFDSKSWLERHVNPLAQRV